MKMIIEYDSGATETFDNFYAVTAIDKGDELGVIFRDFLGFKDCRILAVGGLLKTTGIKAFEAWDAFVKENLEYPWLIKPSKEVLNHKISMSQS